MGNYRFLSQRSSFEEGTVYVIAASLSQFSSRRFLLFELPSNILYLDPKGFALLDFILPSGFRSKPYAVRTLSASGLSVPHAVEDVAGYIFDRVALGDVTIIAVCSRSTRVEQDDSSAFLVIFQQCEDGLSSLVNLLYSQRMALTGRLGNANGKSSRERKAWRVITSLSLFQLLCGSFTLISIVALTLASFSQTTKQLAQKRWRGPPQLRFLAWTRPIFLNGYLNTLADETSPIARTISSLC